MSSFAEKQTFFKLETEKSFGNIELIFANVFNNFPIPNQSVLNGNKRVFEFLSSYEKVLFYSCTQNRDLCCVMLQVLGLSLKRSQTTKVAKQTFTLIRHFTKKKN